MEFDYNSVDVGDLATVISGVGGATIAGALAGTPFANIDEQQLPRGPANRKAKTVVRRLDDIAGVDIGGVEMQKRNWMLEFQMPDRDVHYPSALSLSRDTGDIVEMTLRLGPIGDRRVVDDMEQRDLEGEWVDIVLSAASDVDVIDQLPDNTRQTVDLGDAWISEYLRPHLRLPLREQGYSISPRELTRLIGSIAERFERQYGSFEQRQVDPEFSQRFDATDRNR